MSTVITKAGEQLIAQKIGAGAVLSIDTIILAHIPDLDVSLPVDRDQGKPQQDHVVHEYAIPEEFKGYVNPNQVVYSMLLGSEIGNFQFNWLGLYSSAGDVLVAVTHLPVTEKWQTDKASNTLGNNLTRNFLLQFSGAKTVTNITVEAKTWQVDFTARLRSIDERERLNNRDLYGRSCFFNDGFSVVKESGSYVLKSGAGYVEGIRCVLNADRQLTVSALPKNVFLDVALQQQGSNVVPVVTPLLGSSRVDYMDGYNARHYCIKVAEISAAGEVKDVRRTEAVTSDLVEYLKRRTDNHANRKDDPHNTLAKVKALLSSSITNASAVMIATPLAVKTVYDLLLTHKNANDPHGVVAKVKALLTSSVISTSTTMFATPKAVKVAYDKGVSAYDLANTKINKVNLVVFNSSGIYQKSPNLIAAEVIVTGGGASGGKLYYNGAGGGGGAGTSIKIYSAAEIPSSVSVVIGAGGIGNAGNGYNGGDSKFLSQIGGGGKQSHLYHSGGAGGVASGGDINLRGSGGDVGDHDGAGGAGGASYWGGGGLGSMDESINYLHGFNGSGGGGRDEVAARSGNGGNGVVVIKEFLKG